jgi:hypothetical protein
MMRARVNMRVRLKAVVILSLYSGIPFVKRTS